LGARSQVLQRDIIKHGIGQQPLRLGVLVLERLQTLRLVRLANDSQDHLPTRLTIHPAKLRLPSVESRPADHVLATDLGGRNPRLLLAQHRDNLLFRKPRSLHRPVLPSRRTLPSFGGKCGGHSIRTVIIRSSENLPFHIAVLLHQKSISERGNLRGRGQFRRKNHSSKPVDSALNLSWRALSRTTPTSLSANPSDASASISSVSFTFAPCVR
jgi:hypothetical protein